MGFHIVRRRCSAPFLVGWFGNSFQRILRRLVFGTAEIGKGTRRGYAGMDNSPSFLPFQFFGHTGMSRSRHGRHGKTDIRRGWSVRSDRDCLDHVVVFGERHLRHLLNPYQQYYMRLVRTYRCTRTLLRTVQSVARRRCHFSADCTGLISGAALPVHRKFFPDTRLEIPCSVA
jgi:hypothetical protein